MRSAPEPWASWSLALLLVFGAGASHAMLQKGQRAPASVLAAEDGSVTGMEEFSGQRPVLLAFMGLHCRPCEESLPTLEDIAIALGASHGLKVLCVYLTDEGGLEHVADSHDTRSPLAIFRDVMQDGSYRMASAYGVIGTPTFFLIGRDGTIQWSHVGRLRHPVSQAMLAVHLPPPIQRSSPIPFP